MNFQGTYFIALFVGILFTAKACQQPCIFVSNATDILAVPADLTSSAPVLRNLKRAVAVDVHVTRGLILWSDVTEKSIKRANIDGSNVKVIVSYLIGVCDGLAMEWTTDLLYWSDTTLNRIEVAKLDGSNRSTLISDNLDEPRGVAVDPLSKMLFWTDWGAQPKIERAFLNGENRRTIVSSSLGWPNDIALDHTLKRIYWIDAKIDRIEYADYSGNNRQSLLNHLGIHPFGVDLLNSWLFWTDWATLSGLHKMDTSTGALLGKRLISGIRMGLAVYDSSRQPSSINACQQSNGGCSHLCLLKPGGYDCACPTGHSLQEDGKNCNTEIDSFIAFTDADLRTTNIISLDVQYKSWKILFHTSKNSRPIAIDYDPVEKRIYWTDNKLQHIASAFMNATSMKVLYQKDIAIPDGLAIDSLGRNMYWTDSGTNRIEVGKLDGSSRKTLIHQNLDEPRAIVLYAEKGLMYWTDWGSTPKIETSHMDGTSRKVLSNSGLVWPNGLTIDKINSKLYWADANLDKIEESDLLGNNRRVLISQSGIHPFGLTIYDGDLFWTDWINKSVYSLNIESGKAKRIASGLAKPMDIHTYNLTTFINGSNGCSMSNGGCSDLCLPTPTGRTCACKNGTDLSDDPTKCKHRRAEACEPPCLFVSNATHILAVPADLTSSTPVLQNLSRAVAIDVHVTRKLIFWSDVIDRTIKSVSTNGSNIKIIVNDSIGVCDGLAVEWTTDLLYWSDITLNKIEVAKLDGSRRRTLFYKNLDKPRGVALDPLSRMLFWTDWGAQPKIERAYLNGKNRTTIVSSSLGWPNDIALDHTLKRIYWIDAKIDRIEYADYSGNNRHLLLDNLGIHPFGIDLLNNWLFWTDWATVSGLHKMDKTTGFLLGKRLISGKRMGLSVYDGSRQPSSISACQTNNGGCGYLCLLKAGGFDCVCPISKVLGSDGRICINKAVHSNCSTPNLKPNTVLVTHGCGSYIGSKCTLACRSGYSLVGGSTTITCQQNDTWSGEGPSCSDSQAPVFVSCPNDILAYAEREKTSSIITWATPSARDNSGKGPNITLVAGYTPPIRLNQGVYHVTYMATDSNNNRATCSFTVTVKVINCTSPSVTGVLIVNGCDNHYGGTCNFSCPVGYRLVGMTTLICLATSGGPPGVWNGAVPTCEAITCRALQVPANAIKSGCSGSVREAYGIVCQFKCIHGYKPSVVISRTCQVDGTWSGNDLTCSAVLCPPLRKPTHGSIAPYSCLQSSHFSSVCVYSCANGFSMQGTSSRTCSSNGIWTGQNDTRCEDITSPTFSVPCPSDSVYNLDRCSNDITVNWTKPIATDNSGVVSLNGPSQGPPLKLFPGIYRINYTALDPAGNRRSCSFRIQVNRHVCRTLADPVNGNITFLSCRNAYGSEAIFSCRSGYTMRGSRRRSCMLNGQWSGMDTTCSRVTCPTLTHLSFGTIEPRQCVAGLPVVFGTLCHFKCNLTNGYSNIGPDMVTCTGNGTWSADTSRISCKDSRPPNLRCPSDAKIATDPGRNVSTFYWTVPVPTDNSGDTPSLTVKPNSLSSSHEFPVGITLVEYTAEDSSNLQRRCSFTVTVLDEEAPRKVFCPSDFEVKTGEKIPVFFPQAKFKDNVDVISITTDLNNGSVLNYGRYKVTYTAHDRAGNSATCVLNITISPITCKKPPDPEHGALSCLTLTGGMYCTVHCFKGHVFAVQNPLQICNNKGKWITRTVPDCTAPVSSTITFQGVVRYITKKCESMIEDIRKQFMKTLLGNFMGKIHCQSEPQKCKVENVKVTCSKARKRRSLDDNHNADISFEIRLPLPTNSSSNLNNSIAEVKMSVMETIKKSVSKLEVDGQVLTLKKPSPNALRVVSLSCESGQVLKGAVCVKCPAGYYHSSSTQSCHPCPVNHYQESEGQTSCRGCPSGTATSGKIIGSKSSQSCLKVTTRGLPTTTIIVSVVASLAGIVLGLVLVVCFRRHCQCMCFGSSIRQNNPGCDRVVFGPRKDDHSGYDFNNPAFDDGSDENHIYAEIKELDGKRVYENVPNNPCVPNPTTMEFSFGPTYENSDVFNGSQA